MQRKIISFLLCLVLFAFVLSGCENTNAKSEARALMKAKIIYAIWMDFHDNIRVNYSDPGILEAYFSGEYSDCVIVATADEVENYGEDIIVVWPSERTQETLDSLNQYIDDEKIDITSFSLQYPVTLVDTVEKWEQVNQLMHSLSNSIRDYIWTH
jgi:outer membrane lipoprotein-sorting protein